MPLSEQEQRLLDEMERSLYQNDAEFVATVNRVGQGRRSYTWLLGGIVLGLVGVGVLILGVVLQQPLIGVLGFLVMFGGVLIGLGSPRRPNSASRAKGASGARAPRGRQAGFMDKMNDRWERRQNGDS